MKKIEVMNDEDKVKDENGIVKIVNKEKNGEDVLRMKKIKIVMNLSEDKWIERGKGLVNKKKCRINGKRKRKEEKMFNEEGKMVRNDVRIGIKKKRGKRIKRFMVKMKIENEWKLKKERGIVKKRKVGKKREWMEKNDNIEEEKIDKIKIRNFEDIEELKLNGKGSWLDKKIEKKKKCGFEREGKENNKE